MAKANKHTRIEKLKSMPPVGRKPKPSWFTQLKDDDQAELEEFRRQFQAGEYAGRTENSLYEYWQDELKLTIGSSAFFNWMKRRDIGKA